MFRYCFVITAFAASIFSTSIAEPIKFRDDVDPSKTRISIPLTEKEGLLQVQVSTNNFDNPFIQSNQKNTNVEFVADKEWDYSAKIPSNLYYDSFLVRLKDAKLEFISTNNSENFQTMEISGVLGEEITVLKTGLFPKYGQVIVSYEIPGNTISEKIVDPVQASFSLNINGNSNNIPTGGYAENIDRFLSGRLLLDHVELSVGSLHFYGLDWPGKAFQVTLDPLDDHFPNTTISVKVGEIFKLRDAQVLIESFDPETNVLTLAVIEGDLTVKPKTELNLGDAIVDFSRLNLLTREFASINTLTAGGTKSVLILFGNFIEMPNYAGQPNENFPMGLPSIKKMTEQHTDLSLAIVSTSVDVKSMFGDWLDVQDFALLSNSSNIGLFKFNSSSNNFFGGFMGGQQQGELLSTYFDIPSNNIGIVLIDPTGKLLYYNSNASGTFSAALSEALALKPTTKNP